MARSRPKQPFLDRGHPLARGLKAWLALGEGCGDTTRDSSGFRNHGTLANMDTGTNWVRTPFGPGLEFDGVAATNKKVVVPAHPTLYGGSAGAFSLVALAKPDVVEKNSRVIYHYHSSTGDGYFLGHYESKWLFNKFVDGGYASVASDVPVTTDWQTVVGTADADGTLRLYVDGVPQSSTGTKAGAITPAGDFLIGIDVFDGHEFDGLIALVAFYDRALRPAEIARLYVDPFTPFRPRRRVMGMMPGVGGPYRAASGQTWHTGAAAGQTFSSGQSAGQIDGRCG